MFPMPDIVPWGDFADIVSLGVIQVLRNARGVGMYPSLTRGWGYLRQRYLT